MWVNIGSCIVQHFNSFGAGTHDTSNLKVKYLLIFFHERSTDTLLIAL